MDESKHLCPFTRDYCVGRLCACSVKLKDAEMWCCGMSVRGVEYGIVPIVDSDEESDE